MEIGTGCGTSGIWLLRGMRQDGVLTSVDVDPEHQRLARKAFTTAGFATNRYRLISGKAADVLPRLTDGGYDLVFCDADKQEYPELPDRGAAPAAARRGRRLRQRAVGRARSPIPAMHRPGDIGDPGSGRAVREDERLVPLLLPVGDGLLAAVKAADGGLLARCSQRSSSRVPNPVAPLASSPSSERGPGRPGDVQVRPAGARR